jgi:hypothetical protein
MISMEDIFSQILYIDVLIVDDEYTIKFDDNLCTQEFKDKYDGIYKFTKNVTTTLASIFINDKYTLYIQHNLIRQNKIFYVECYTNISGELALLEKHKLTKYNRLFYNYICKNVGCVILPMEQTNNMYVLK